jgi:hypothetical protein
LLEYFSKHEVPTRAFDTETPKGTLQRFHPDVSEIVDVTAVADQMRIFDTVSDTSVTVIDVRAGLLSSTLRALRDISFLDTANEGQLTFIVFHILGSSIASLDEIEETASLTTGGRHFMVKNFINDASFFEWDQAIHKSYFKKSRYAEEVTVPRLRELAYEQVELASVPFTTFIANKSRSGEAVNYSFVLRGYVRHWPGQVWDEYDRIKLRSIITGRHQVHEILPMISSACPMSVGRTRWHIKKIRHPPSTKRGLEKVTKRVEVLATSSSRYRNGHATARYLFRANLRAHSFRPPFDLIKSVRHCPAGFAFRAYRNTLDHLLRVLASAISGSDVQKITMPNGSGFIAGASC